MKRNLVRLNFYETYYYANIIDNIIYDPFPYIRGIHDWYENAEEDLFLPPFPKVSRLHSFAAYIIDSLISEKISEKEITKLIRRPKHQVWVDRALKYHGFQCDGFRNWLADQNVSNDDLNIDHLYDYHLDLKLTGELETLVEHLSNEVFYLLFGNRKLLANFNEFLARANQLSFDQIPESELGRHLKSPGVLKRVKTPSWVKRAVFFRDRGHCSSCQKDLSGLVTAQTDPHYDHIIPLAMGGLNDVTNIQLLCQPCNNTKSADFVSVSCIYESWY